MATFQAPNVDQLTGLMNRSAFHAVLDDARLADHEMLIVLFFDLDRFKEVNDTLGHRVRRRPPQASRRAGLVDREPVDRAGPPGG